MDLFTEEFTWMKLMKTFKMAIDLSTLLYETFPTVTRSDDLPSAWRASEVL